MKIFLIGYMGCGKSTLGKQLAKKLFYKFVDMDNYIEEREQMKVEEIFATHGEQYFREREREALKELTKCDNIVVATGGGVAVHYDNIDVMNRAGVTIYIKINSGILVSRLSVSRTPRPLLQGKTHEEMVALVDEMLAKREPFYSQALITIEGKNIRVDDLLEAVKEW